MENRKQIGTIEMKTAAGDTCANCRFRRELYPKAPSACKECGFFKYRNDKYTTQVPVYEDNERKENE